MDTPDTPRSFRRLFLKLGGWFAIFPLIPALVTGAIAMFEGRKAERLEADGAVAQALIEDKRIVVTTDSDGDKSTSYYLDFSFSAESGAVRDSESVGRGFYNSLPIGATTPIRYWRPDPQVNEIEPGSTATTIFWTKIISALLLAATGAWVHRCWRRAKRAIAVRDGGVRRRAEVIGHIDTRVRINKVRQYRLHWRDEAGAEGRSWFVSGRRIDAFPEGTELTVYADPAGRLPAVWEADVGPARAVAGGRATVRRG